MAVRIARWQKALDENHRGKVVLAGVSVSGGIEDSGHSQDSCCRVIVGLP